MCKEKRKVKDLKEGKKGKVLSIFINVKCAKRKVEKLKERKKGKVLSIFINVKCAKRREKWRS